MSLPRRGNEQQSTLKHRTGRSQDSGIADSCLSAVAYSTMSIGNESLHLAEFPQPPASLPTTPIRSDFGSSSPVSSRFNVSSQGSIRSGLSLQAPAPLTPRRKGYGHATSAGSSSQRLEPLRENYVPPIRASPLSRRSKDGSHSPSSLPLLSRQPSVHDWHDGSSSICTDGVDDGLLTTSFITSLLSSQEEPVDVPSARRRADSRNDDALSEMTYPPGSSYAQSPVQQQRPLPQARPRVPPSSYAGIEQKDPQSRISGDSDTLHSQIEFDSSVVRTASTSRLPGTKGNSVVGFAPATLRLVSGQGIDPNARLSSRPIGTEKTEWNSDHEKRDLAQYTFGRSSQAFGSPAPPVAPAQPRLPRSTSHSRRDSVRTNVTTRSIRSFLSSLTNSTDHNKRAFGWLRKPLPPVPVIPHITVAQAAQHRHMDDSMPLPQLIDRAGTLSHMLDKGYHPHHSYDSRGQESWKDFEMTDEDIDPMRDYSYREPATHGDISQQQRGLNRKASMATTTFDEPWNQTANAGTSLPASTKKKKIAITIIIVVATVAIVVAVVVGVSLKTKKHGTISCSGNLTGSACDLDATCVCTSSLKGQCNGLAQSLVTLTPTLSTLFGTNLSVTAVATAIWQAQGAPLGGNCASQALLVDVAPGLKSASHPNRTQWAQSAILWNLIQSQDLTAATTMRNFVAEADWSSNDSTDGPFADPSNEFSASISGFSFDFAEQSVTQPSVTFIGNGQPSSAQISQVGDIARTSLDRMYSYALASSTQRQQAMINYWRTVLQQAPADLALFMSAVSSSPVLLPFDATSSPIAEQLTTSTTALFPPPLACYPGLSAAQVQRVNAIETSAFGLAALSAATQFNSQCFPDRPIYGVLDILRLRTPFIDARANVSKQAAVLSRDASSRVVVYSGEALSALPGTPSSSTVSVNQLDPRQYGTLNHLYHVMLNYLSSIQDVNIAIALVKYVLAGQTVPPTNTSTVFSSLSSLPLLEVAVFGAINPSDISSSVSSLTTPSGSLFFGSKAATELRQWAITGASSSVVWTESSISPEVVRDSSFTNANFNQIFDNVATFLNSKNSGVIVNVGNITTAFQSTGLFSP